MTARPDAAPAATSDPRLRDLPPAGWPRLRRLLGRALLRHCPQCGSADIFANWLTIKDECPRCGYHFARETGYFLGAYALNLILAEFIAFGVMVALLIWSDYGSTAIVAITVPLMVALPFLFFPYSRTFWMAFDLWFQPENQR